MSWSQNVLTLLDEGIAHLVYNTNVIHSWSMGDTILSPLLNSLEESTMKSCGRLGLGGRTRFPTL